LDGRAFVLTIGGAFIIERGDGWLRCVAERLLSMMPVGGAKGHFDGVESLQK